MPVDVPKVSPVEPGEPIEVPAASQMGATFAERAKAAKKTSSKQVKADGAEDKAVAKKSTSSK